MKDHDPVPNLTSKVKTNMGDDGKCMYQPNLDNFQVKEQEFESCIHSARKVLNQCFVFLRQDIVVCVELFQNSNNQLSSIIQSPTVSLDD